MVTRPGHFKKEVTQLAYGALEDDLSPETVADILEATASEIREDATTDPPQETG